MTRRRDPRRILAASPQPAPSTDLPPIDSPEAFELIYAAHVDYLRDPERRCGATDAHPPSNALAEGYGLAADIEASERARTGGPVWAVWQAAGQRARRDHLTARRLEARR